MENKKLLKYLLKDINELSEMFSERDKNRFDDMEMEFIRNRLAGAQRLVELFIDNEDRISEIFKTDSLPEQKPEYPAPGIAYPKQEIRVDIKSHERPENEKTPTAGKLHSPGVFVHEGVLVSSEIKQEKTMNQPVTEKSSELSGADISSKQKEMELVDEEPEELANKRIGDSFQKEKSVNDLLSDDSSKLEHKLSNRPVTSIQTAIGINDRFQYIRELFEGNADNFVKTVADLDSMNDIKEAVEYLQQNFKWKKNETSLKFVNLIKRRFPNA